jgi:chromosome segregation ATPase
MPSAAPPATLKAADLAKLIEELKALKTRSYSLDLQRLEESQKAELDSAMKAAEKRVRTGGADLLKAQAEERRIAESKHQRDKELLAAKFSKLDASLQALAAFLQQAGPAKEQELRLFDREAQVRKSEEELNVQRKVFAREQDELEQEKQLLHAAESKLAEREKELTAKLANLDLVRRAKELDARSEEIESKLKAYGEQEALLEKQRSELNRDFDKLGQKRAELDAEAEHLEAERADLTKQKAGLGDAVAHEMAMTFEAFLKDLVRSGEIKSAPAPVAASPPPPPVIPARKPSSTAPASDTKSRPRVPDAPPPAPLSGEQNPWADLPP